MEPLLNFGIAQEDARTEFKALRLKTGDRVLSIASAGEVPLNLATFADVSITAVDTSSAQLFLTRLKLLAVLHLEPSDAAGLLGYIRVPRSKRQKGFDHLRANMTASERKFWDEHNKLILAGVIAQARFEKYLMRFLPLGLIILGRKHVKALLEMESVEEQRDYFDKKFRTALLSRLFKIAFHPKIYKKRGMAEQGLTHSGERDIAEFFFSRFRDFCTANLARENFYYQFFLFGQVLDKRGLPEFLTEKGAELIRQRSSNFVFKQASYESYLRDYPVGAFNKFHLSNIGDWMSQEEFASLQHTLVRFGASDSKGLIRYIHKNHPIPKEIEETFVPDREQALEISRRDRFPFYSFIPFALNSAADQ